MQFSQLEDTPMFRQEIQCVEENAELMRGRCLKFYKGCRKYTEGLVEGYAGDIAFVNALETFGGDQNDPTCVAFGGPVMNKFIVAFREITSYKEALRSQSADFWSTSSAADTCRCGPQTVDLLPLLFHLTKTEHMLNDRLLQFVNVDLQDIKDARKPFDKASLAYDQAREKFMSLRKSTKTDVAAAIEEELLTAKTSFELARFNLVSALFKFESKKGFEFLEAVSGMMEAHLRFFKQGYELLNRMEPFINQVDPPQGPWRYQPKLVLELEEVEAIMQALADNSDGSWNKCANSTSSLSKTIILDFYPCIRLVVELPLEVAHAILSPSRLRKEKNFASTAPVFLFPPFLDQSMVPFLIYGVLSCPKSSRKQATPWETWNNFLSQVLDYAQKSRECSNYEQESLSERMQEHIRQIEQGKLSLTGYTSPSVADGMQPYTRGSQKIIEAVMQSAANGKVQTIRQGYLSKRSSNLRGDWKRRFFVLDSRGMLYYYRKPFAWSSAGGSQSTTQKSSSENGQGLLSRWLSNHYHSGANDEKSVTRHTVNLLTSTIKVDADQSDLMFCFRIISPTKIYTLQQTIENNRLAMQAENALDQRDWIEKITGVITSLLSSQTPESSLSAFPMRSGGGDNNLTSDSSLVECPDGFQTTTRQYMPKIPSTGSLSDIPKSLQHQENYEKNEKPIDILRKVPGNDKCADCGEPEPDWASLNLGLLICIECSGVHRNLGVHISKVRSLKLDVKVWEPSVLALFQSLGNFYVNSIWEELNSGHTKTVLPVGSSKSEGQKQLPKTKPSHDDPISAKELFIHAKYAEKAFVCKLTDNPCLLSVAEEVWESVRSNDPKALYRHIVCNGADVNTIYGDSRDQSRSSNLLNERGDQIEKEHFDGCSLLHLACLNTDIGMVELLLQYGANVNASDSRGRVPLHLCLVGRKFAIAKLLMSRGADPQAVDGEGKTPLQLALASGINDNETPRMEEMEDGLSSFALKKQGYSYTKSKGETAS
ncbi:ADP-ribosylation factor GTPase-activating protein AGD1 [Hibiscus syriacus]|uniref:ADP-ribosylation factor GTPase-activating protein AGD1 n=1 Tax=Hibiscus syriacus TaxID=106335 RepID=A0A6A3AMZ6_HIBSY|nr:ADP-ribosylation factor GTPase-activating protein AGD1 [Hibiscus syriacus]